MKLQAAKCVTHVTQKCSCSRGMAHIIELSSILCTKTLFIQDGKLHSQCLKIKHCISLSVRWLLRQKWGIKSDTCFTGCLKAMHLNKQRHRAIIPTLISLSSQSIARPHTHTHSLSLHGSDAYDNSFAKINTLHNKIRQYQIIAPEYPL